MNKNGYIIIFAALVILTAIAAGCTSTNANTGSNAGAQTTSDPTNPAANPTQTAAPDTDGIVRDGNTVSVYYVGTLDDGTVFDKKVKGTDTPLTFTVGSGTVVKGFNNAVIGMKVGETKTVHLTPDLAYGEYNDQLIQEFDKSIFGDADLGTFSPGDTVYLRSANGIFPVKIYSIGNNSVFLDLNHRLAGKNLNFEITVDSVN